MIYIFLFILIVFALFLILATQNKKKEPNSKSNYYDNEDLFFADRKLTRHQDTVYQKGFTPNKIIENDNALNQIVPDYKEREQIVIKELENNLGKALPNDVKWSILQTLSSEYFLKDHKIIVNVSYQRGLLLQKEKKYKEAISHYSYGLYYLMNFYQADFNPTAHFIDQVETANGLIEMAQQKFINKIELCINYQQFNINDMKENILLYVNISTLPQLTAQDFFRQVESYIKKHYEKEQDTLQHLDNEQDFNYLSIVNIIPKLKREKKYPEAIELLKKAIASIQNEKQNTDGIGTTSWYFDEPDEQKYSNYNTPPWYFYQLAVIYRKEKQYEDEVQVIKDYLNITKDEKYRDNKITDRLEKVESLIKK